MLAEYLTSLACLSDSGLGGSIYRHVGAQERLAVLDGQRNGVGNLCAARPLAEMAVSDCFFAYGVEVYGVVSRVVWFATCPWQQCVALTDVRAPAFKLGDEVNSGGIALGNRAASGDGGANDGEGGGLDGEFDHFGKSGVCLGVKTDCSCWSWKDCLMLMMAFQKRHQRRFIVDRFAKATCPFR